MSRLSGHVIALLSVVALAVSAYANSLSVPFYFDDLPNIVNNPHIRLTQWDVSQLWRAGVDSVLPTRPLAYASFAANHIVGGLAVQGFHVVNLVIHVLASGAVYLIALLLLDTQPSIGAARPTPLANIALAAACAAVFAVHPLQVQAVTYIVQRMTSMAAMFYLYAFALYLLGRNAGSPQRRWGLWLAALVAWVLAMASKEIALPLPLAVVLYEWCFHQRVSARAWMLRALALVPVAVLALAALFVAMGADPFAGIMAGYAVFPFSLTERVLTELRVVVFYLWLFVWPSPGALNLLHAFEPSTSLLQPISTLFSAGAIVAGVLAAAFGRRRWPIVTFAVGWYFLHLMIESTVLPLALIFEHRVYLPFLGPVLLVVFGIRRFAAGGRLRARSVTVLTIAMVMALGVATWTRNQTWSDPVTLWSDVVAKNPSSAAAWTNLATAQIADGNFEAAEQAIRNALQITPGDARVRSNLALVLLNLGRLDEAESHLRITLRQRPRLAEAHQVLARVFERQGRFDLALRHYKLAEELPANRAHNPQFGSGSAR